MSGSTTFHLVPQFTNFARRLAKITNNLIDLSIVPTKYHELTVSQTSFSLYLHNQWTDFHKLSCSGKPQMRAIRTYVGCTKATTND